MSVRRGGTAGPTAVRGVAVPAPPLGDRTWVLPGAGVGEVGGEVSAPVGGTGLRGGTPGAPEKLPPVGVGAAVKLPAARAGGLVKLPAARAGLVKLPPAREGALVKLPREGVAVKLAVRAGVEAALPLREAGVVSRSSQGVEVALAMAAGGLAGAWEGGGGRGWEARRANSAEAREAPPAGPVDLQTNDVHWSNAQRCLGVHSSAAWDAPLEAGHGRCTKAPCRACTNPRTSITGGSS